MMKVKLVPVKTELHASRIDLTRLLAQLEHAMADAPDVLVLSEMWNTGFDVLNVRQYADTDGSCAKFLSAFAAKHQVNIVGGSVAVLERDRLYNRAMVFDRKGKLVHQYDKMHLFSYADEHQAFTAGEDNRTFELEGMTCALIICYDLRFGEQVLALHRQGAEVLFVPAAWPSPRIEHWDTLLKARAIEFQMYVIGVNDGLYGHAGIYDPLGNKLSETQAEITREGLANRQSFPVFSDRKASY